MSDYVFQGNYFVKVSERMEIVIPEKFYLMLGRSQKINYVLERNRLDDSDNFFYNTLLFVPYEIRDENAFMDKVETSDLTFTHQSSTVDSHRRVRVPKDLLKLIGLGSQSVGVVVGSLDYFVLFSKKGLELEEEYLLSKKMFLDN